MKPVRGMTSAGVPVRNGGIGPLKALEANKHTLERREATVKDQLEIAKVTLSQDDGGQLLGLGEKLGLAGQIAGEKVLEDTTVGSVGHGCEL